jgi:GAF domain-containing protein
MISQDAMGDGRIVLSDHRAAMTGALGAVMCFPLKSGGEIVGTLHLFCERGNCFGQEDLQLAMRLADQAGIAIENARLYERLETHSNRLHTLARLNQLISSSLDMNAVLHEICDAAAALTGASMVHFLIADESTQTLKTCAQAYGTIDFPVQALRFGQGGGWLGGHSPEAAQRRGHPHQRAFRGSGLVA